MQAFIRAAARPPLFILPLVAAGLLVGLVGIVVERGLLRFVYDRDETFQLLLTFAVVLMLEDVIRMIWGTAPTSTVGPLPGLRPGRASSARPFPSTT